MSEIPNPSKMERRRNAGFNGGFKQIQLLGFCEFVHWGKILTPAHH
jgi:hypothetical protein